MKVSGTSGLRFFDASDKRQAERFVGLCKTVQFLLKDKPKIADMAKAAEAPAKALLEAMEKFSDRDESEAPKNS